MRDVVFEVMFAEAKRFRIDAECLGDQPSHVAHRLLTLTQADEVENLDGIRQRVLNFFRQVRIAILAYRHVIDIGNLRANEVEAGFNRERRKTSVVLNAVQALFGNRENNLAVLHQCSRRVRVKHVQSQNQHWLEQFPRFNSVGAFFMPVFAQRTSAMAPNGCFDELTSAVDHQTARASRPKIRWPLANSQTQALNIDCANNPETCTNSVP